MASEDDVRRVWTLGSYADVGRNFLSMAGRLVDAAGVEPGDRVLDVACGTGNVAITAARQDAVVSGLDITPAMLEDARGNAEIAGVPDVDWREGNAIDLPFGDDAFDVTLSCVGHVFADPPAAAARELVRVTRPGGTVAFTSWTPDSVVPAMAGVVQEYLPPDPDAPEPPVLWGDPEVVAERLAGDVAGLEFETGTVDQLSLSPAHFWTDARTQSGLFIVALDDVAEDDVPDVRAAMIAAVDRYFDDRRNVVSMEYQLSRATVR